MSSAALGPTGLAVPGAEVAAGTLQLAMVTADAPSAAVNSVSADANRRAGQYLVEGPGHEAIEVQMVVAVAQVTVAAGVDSVPARRKTAWGQWTDVIAAPTSLLAAYHGHHFGSCYPGLC